MTGDASIAVAPSGRASGARRARGLRGGQGCIERGLGGGYRPPPFRAPSLRPATVSLTANASFNGICNRQ